MKWYKVWGLVIIALSQLYVWILAIERVPELVAAFVIGLNMTAIVILISGLAVGLVLITILPSLSMWLPGLLMK